MAAIKPLPCILCDKELEPAFKDLDNNQPYGATTFQSHGQYGSTVWDEPPSSRRWLEINICDECLVRKGEEGTVLMVEPIPVRTEYERELWTGRHDQ